jgi:hypothetical protein
MNIAAADVPFLCDLIGARGAEWFDDEDFATDDDLDALQMAAVEAKYAAIEWDCGTLMGSSDPMDEKVRRALWMLMDANPDEFDGIMESEEGMFGEQGELDGTVDSDLAAVGCVFLWAESNGMDTGMLFEAFELIFLPPVPPKANKRKRID